MEEIVAPSTRRIKPTLNNYVSPGMGGLGIAPWPNTMRQDRRAFQKSVLVQTTPRQLSEAAVIPSSAPFKLAIRNASFNLNYNPIKAKFTPRSGIIPRMRGTEGDTPCGDDLVEESDGCFVDEADLTKDREETAAEDEEKRWKEEEAKTNWGKTKLWVHQAGADTADWFRTAGKNVSHFFKAPT
jgi:hypothetical protein